MASSIDHYLTTFLIFFIIFPFSVHSDKITITLFNDTYEILRVACKSSTHQDLGVKILRPNDYIKWTGDINVPGDNEIWWCLLNTSGNLKGVFALFNAHRDQTRCGPHECFWDAMHDGIYLYLPDDGMTLQFHWGN